MKLKSLLLAALLLLSFGNIYSQEAWNIGGENLQNLVVDTLTVYKIHVDSLYERTSGHGILFFDHVFFKDSVTFQGVVSYESLVTQSTKWYDTDGDTVVINPSGFDATNSNGAGTRILQYKDLTTEFFFVDTTGIGYFSGNVGIGTETPAMPLEVSKVNASVGIAFERVDAVVGSDQYIGSLLWRAGEAAEDTVGEIGVVATSTWNGTSSTTDMVFKTTTTGTVQAIERMRITSDGNVGIGTTTPEARLHVVGADNNYAEEQITSYRASAFTHGLLTFEAARGTQSSPDSLNNNDEVGWIRFNAYDGTDFESEAAEIKVLIDDNTGSNDTPGRMNFYTTADGAQAGTMAMAITDQQYVGIGTESPAAKTEIEIADADNAIGLLIDHNETGSKSALEIDSENTGSSALYVTGKYPAYLSQDISSGYGLTVIRDIAEAGSLPLARIIDENSSNTQPSLYVRQDGTGDIINLFDGGTEVFTVLNGGNVGIGTDEPDSTLDVAGGINADGGLAVAGIIDHGNPHTFLHFADSTADSPNNMTQNTWEVVTNAWGTLFEESEVTGMTMSGDSIQCTTAGDYDGILSLTILGSNGDDYEVRIMVNNTEISKMSFEIGPGTTGFPVAVPFYAEVDANEYVYAQVRNTSNNNDCQFASGIFKCFFYHL